MSSALPICVVCVACSFACCVVYKFAVAAGPMARGYFDAKWSEATGNQHIGDLRTCGDQPEYRRKASAHHAANQPAAALLRVVGRLPGRRGGFGHGAAPRMTLGCV